MFVTLSDNEPSDDQADDPTGNSELPHPSDEGTPDPAGPNDPAGGSAPYPTGLAKAVSSKI